MQRPYFQIMNRMQVENNKAIEKFTRLTGMNTMKQHFSKVAITISNYIDQAEAFIARLAKYQNNMSRSELAYLSEWTYWIREIKIKAGEWVEIFLDEDLQNFTVWMEKDIRSIPGSLIIVKSPLESSIPIRKLIQQLKRR